MLKKFNEQKLWWKPNLNFNKIIKNAKITIKNNHITFSKNCIFLENFLKKKLKVKHIVLCNSGTSALFMATLVAKIHKKKKIFSPAITWPGTINGALYANKKIKLIDSRKKEINANYNSILNKINRNDLLFITHMNGKSAYDRDLFYKLKKKKIFIIEDAAQSFLVKDFKNSYLGTSFDIGCFSLGITKMCNMVYGGFCATNNDKIYSDLKRIRNNGEDNEYQITTSPGGNFKPNDLNASVGMYSLKNCETNIKNLIKVYETYDKNLKNNKLELINFDIKNGDIPLYIEILTNNRKKLIQYLKKNKIGYSYSTRTLSISPHIKKGNRCKNAEEIDQKLLRLPSGPGYPLNEIKLIINKLNKFS